MIKFFSTSLDAVKKPFKHRNIIIVTTFNDIKARYAGSFLGSLWLFLAPVIFLSLYALIYIFIYRIKLKILSPCEYIFFIFSGLIPFLSFSEAIGRGTQAVTANSNLVKNTLFPIELIPIQFTLCAQSLQFVGFILLIVVSLIFNKLTVITVLFLPLLWILQILFTIGVVWLLSALNVFFRDISNIISIMILMLMMISPISYTENMIPGALKLVLYINPLYYMIILYQKIFIFGKLDVLFLIVFSIISLCFYFFGYYVFITLKDVFSDYV